MPGALKVAYDVGWWVFRQICSASPITAVVMLRKPPEVSLSLGLSLSGAYTLYLLHTNSYIAISIILHVSFP